MSKRRMAALEKRLAIARLVFPRRSSWYQEMAVWTNEVVNEQYQTHCQTQTRNPEVQSLEHVKEIRLKCIHLN